MAKLLIVDDEEDVREFAANFFRKRKLDVMTAASGEEAIESVKADKPDLVLLDIRMGGISGIQTLEQIKISIKVSKSSWLPAPGLKKMNLTTHVFLLARAAMCINH